MNKDNIFSDEQLNAYVDDELDSEERNQLLNGSVQSTDLGNRICQLRNTKELVNLAYQDIPAARQEHRINFTNRLSFRQALVASILLIVGLGSGMVINQQFMSASGNGQLPVADARQTENYILHVVSGEEEQMLAALRQARQLLEQSNGQPRQIEVVANEKGLNLLRSDITPFAEEISALADKDIIFYACARAIERLEEKGVSVQLVPEAHSHSTALDRLVLRMQEGWNYQKI